MPRFGAPPALHERGLRELISTASAPGVRTAIAVTSRPDADPERGAWRDEPDVYRGGETFELPGLTRAIAVDEVYDRLLDAGGRSLLR